MDIFFKYRKNPFFILQYFNIIQDKIAFLRSGKLGVHLTPRALATSRPQNLNGFCPYILYNKY